MKTIKADFLLTALVAVLLTTFGAGLAQAQSKGGSNYGGGYGGGYDNNNNCSGGYNQNDDDNDDEEYDNDYSRKLNIVGLTSDQRLICFDEFNPGRANTLARISGLITDINLVGVDFRPATGFNADGTRDGGDLYGLGNAGGVYTIDIRTGQATLRSRLNVALSGTFFGVDFNPTVDRLRVISDNGQNLRINVDTGATTVDASLNYTPGTAATGVTGAAYTNNDADPNTATTLYDLDSTLDQVSIQAPPNAGTLNQTGKLTVDTTPNVGFDIYSTIRNNSTVNVEGFASLTVNDRVRFYSITLFTGRAISRGSFSDQNRVVDIAIPLNQR